LRAYFPFQKSPRRDVQHLSEHLRSEIRKDRRAAKWIDDLQLYLVTDSATGEPLGMFYLDMFPREGKFNHFAQFVIISGKLLPNGNISGPLLPCSAISRRRVAMLHH
jgi:Zn-dependent oligopeptidases